MRQKRKENHERCSYCLSLMGKKREFVRRNKRHETMRDEREREKECTQCSTVSRQKPYSVCNRNTFSFHSPMLYHKIQKSHHPKIFIRLFFFYPFKHLYIWYKKYVCSILVCIFYTISTILFIVFCTFCICTDKNRKEILRICDFTISALPLLAFTADCCATIAHTYTHTH